MAKDFGRRELTPVELVAIGATATIVAALISSAVWSASWKLAVVIACGILVPVGAALAGIVIAQREVSRFAVTHHWIRRTDGDSALAQGRRMYPFDAGPGNVTLLAEGEWHGQRAATFTYQVPKNSTYFPEKYRVTAIAVGVELPGVYVIPRKARLVTPSSSGHTIAFESAEFEREWRAVGSDARVVHGLIDPRMMELLLLPGSRGRVVVFDGSAIYTVRPGAHSGTHTAEDLDLLSAIGARIPQHVRRSHVREAPTARPLFERPAPGASRLNWLGWVSYLLAVTFVGAPVALVLSRVASRAVATGRASNPVLVREARGMALVSTVLVLLVGGVFLYAQTLEGPPPNRMDEIMGPQVQHRYVDVGPTPGLPGPSAPSPSAAVSVDSP